MSTQVLISHLNPGYKSEIKVSVLNAEGTVQHVITVKDGESRQVCVHQDNSLVILEDLSNLRPSTTFNGS